MQQWATPAAEPRPAETSARQRLAFGCRRRKSAVKALGLPQDDDTGASQPPRQVVTSSQALLAFLWSERHGWSPSFLSYLATFLGGFVSGFSGFRDGHRRVRGIWLQTSSRRSRPPP